MLSRVLICVLAGVSACLLGGTAASAHVEVETDNTQAGARNVTLTFTAESESEDAGIVSLRVGLPEGLDYTDISLVSAPRKWSLERSRIGYTVSGPALPAGRDGVYKLRVARLPDAHVIRFPTIQTYSDGQVDSWVQVPARPGSEPDMPAPTLRLTGASRTQPPSQSASTADASSSQSSDSSTVPLVIAVLVGLGLAAAGFVLARQRKRG